MFDGGIMEALWPVNQRQHGVGEQNDDENESSHIISTFINNISQLKEGTYRCNGKDWECINCKD